jgi:endonuclease YncB( thermonuclease family)
MVRGQGDRSAKRLLHVVALVCLSSSALAVELTGRVVGISDGDTLTILDGAKRQHRIRLADIDAPERKQPFGTRARQSLSEMCFHKSVRVAVQGRDRYDRVIGRPICAGIDASDEQVRRGLAWVFQKYAPNSPLLAVEDQARRSKVGLWGDANPVPPWDWRKANRKSDAPRTSR